MSPAPRFAAGAGAQAHDDVGRLHSWRCGGDRLLYRRGADAARLVTYYVLFFIHLESRRYTRRDHRSFNVPWMKQIARNVTMYDLARCGDCRYLLHDRDTKFTRSFWAHH